MMITLQLMFSFLITFLAGRLFFEIPALSIKDEGPGIKIPLYFMSGSVIISLYMFLLFLIHVKYSVCSISAPFLIYLVYYCLFNLKYLPDQFNNFTAYFWDLIKACGDRGNILFIASLIPLILMLITVILENLITPIYIGDVYCMWFFKAKAIFTARTIPLDLFTDINLWFNSPSYPLLTSLNVAWIATCQGHWSDTVTKSFYTSMYLAMMVFFYHSLKRSLKSNMAMIGTFITFSLPHIIGDITTGYVDLVVSFYGCVAVILLLNWMNNKSRYGYLWLSAFFIGGAAWTHNEGLMLFAAIFLTLFVFCIAQLLKKRISAAKAVVGILGYFLIYYAVTGPFKAFITHYKLNQLWVSNFWQLFDIVHNLYRLPTILGYLCYELFLDTYLWLYFWIFLIIISIVNRKNIFETNLQYILLFVILSIAMIVEVFLISFSNISLGSIVSVIKLNLDRAMLIITPSAGFLMFLSFSNKEN